MTDFAAILGPIAAVEVIAAGLSVRDRARMRRLYGPGRWRKMKCIARIRLLNGTSGWLNCTGMKHMASASAKSNARNTSTRRMARRAARLPRGAWFVVCVNNVGYEVSLERNKIYMAIPDARAAADGDIRVVDESGEDYLFSADRFVAIEVPQAVRASVRRAS